MIYLKRVNKKDEWSFDSFNRFKIICWTPPAAGDSIQYKSQI